MSIGSSAIFRTLIVLPKNEIIIETIDNHYPFVRSIKNTGKTTQVNFENQICYRLTISGVWVLQQVYIKVGLVL